MRPLALLALLSIAGVGCGPPVANEPSPSPVAVTSDAAPRSSDESRVYPRGDLEVRKVVLAGKPFRLWIMDSGGKRQEGMMFLRDGDVEADQGMLFAFPDVQLGDRSHGFWMRNCPLALDIVYISPNNKVVNIGRGEPFNETTVPPSGDYQHVVELKAGTAAKIGLKPGMSVDLPKDLKPEADVMPPSEPNAPTN